MSQPIDAVMFQRRCDEVLGEHVIDKVEARPWGLVYRCDVVGCALIFVGVRGRVIDVQDVNRETFSYETYAGGGMMFASVEDHIQYMKREVEGYS